MKYNLLLLSALSILIYGCHESKKSDVINVNVYDYSEKKVEENQTDTTNCEYFLKKGYLFSITHENSGFDLEKYNLIIWANGNIIYDDSYKPSISLPSNKICFSSSDYFSSISVWLIDKKDSKVFIWGKKEVFDFNAFTQVYIKLQSDSDYEIKLK